MKGIEKSVFGSFFRICEYGSEAFRVLNLSSPYLTVKGEEKKVDVIKIVPFGTNEKGIPLFCFELLWR